MTPVQQRVQNLLEIARDETQTPVDRHCALDEIFWIRRRGHYSFAKLGMDKYTVGTARIAINR